MQPPTAPRRSNRILLALVVLAVLALAAAVIGLVVSQKPAHATSQPGTGYASAGVVPGGTCTTPGVQARHGTQKYRCWQKPGEDCPHWHWIYNPDVPKSTRSAWPAAPCTTCSPSPIPPTSSPPAATTPPASSPSSPAAVPHPADTSPPAAVDVPAAVQPPAPPAAGGTLPVTGAPATLAALLGLVLTAAGGLIRFWPRRC